MTPARISTKTSPAPTGFLASLILSTEQAPTKAEAIQRSPRKVMLDAINEQIKIVEAEMRGETYKVARTKVSKADDGSRLKSEVRVAPRRMFWKADDGGWLVCLRYGGRIPVELSPGKPSIVAGAGIKEVIAVLEVVRDAVNAGELDASIQNAAVKAKRKGAGIQKE